MADIQRQFDEFHDLIRLATYDENDQLREKRDMLVGELRENLKGKAPSFDVFDQGSYALRTGVKPTDGNFDIDEGLLFDAFSDEYSDPLTLKTAAMTAIERHNRTVRIRRPCVTVEYLLDGLVDYHVDLAVYTKRRDGKGLDLALGRPDMPAHERKWQQSDPKGLIAAIKNRFTGEQAAQMRRVIRYLKRWRDHRFAAGKGPVSVVLTLAAYHWFSPQFDTFMTKASDAKALMQLASAMLNSFIFTIDPQGQTYRRLHLHSPVVPKEDLLANYSRETMELLYERLQELKDVLIRADQEPLPEKACRLVATQFGSEFPVPTEDQTAKRVRAPYISTGQSA